MDVLRISRALNQPLFLIGQTEDVECKKYIVSGLSSTYEVGLPECKILFRGEVNDFGDEKLLQNYPLTDCDLREVCCTCPDYMRRFIVCKHVFFVLLKVLKVHCDVSLTRRRYWQHAQRGKVKQFIVKARSVLNHECPENFKNNEDCSICLDEFKGHEQSVVDDKICYCHGCGQKFHSVCMSVWTNTQNTRKKTCPLCRHALN